ncbi:MAG: Asp-tRNA(Asn)/Glu-tRNA(Gln) amidotransferase subunit GatC [Bdellovibrionales bacterium]|nr:Asp-tRNA(Asn)/Glu-tRNA(Gln) amidotransferase subunit GatC [Bdellovibrionales bacterium]
MSLGEKEILHVARLSALELSADEVREYGKDLNDILEFVDSLNAVSIHGVPPTSHVHGVVNEFRDDVLKDSLSVEDVARNAPDFKGGGFRVPKVI